MKLVLVVVAGKDLTAPAGAGVITVRALGVVVVIVPLVTDATYEPTQSRVTESNSATPSAKNPLPSNWSPAGLVNWNDMDPSKLVSTLPRESNALNWRSKSEPATTSPTGSETTNSRGVTVT